MKLYVNKKKINPLILLNLIFLIALIPGSATVVWSEDFNSDLGGFKLGAFTRSTGVFVDNLTAVPTIVDGTLQMPNTRNSHHTWSYAYHNSSTAYGTWSIDFTIKEGADHTVCAGIWFIVNEMPWNATASWWDPLEIEGYLFNIKSGPVPDDFWGADFDHSVNLGHMNTQHSYNVKASHTFSENIVGTHHVDITRNISGQLNIYYDYDPEPIMKYFGNFTGTASRFLVGSWIGDISFDNITVSDTVNPPTTTPTTGGTPGFEFGLSLLSISFVYVVIRKRKTKDK